MLEYVTHVIFVKRKQDVSRSRLNLKLIKCVNALNVLIYIMKMVIHKQGQCTSTRKLLYQHPYG